MLLQLWRQPLNPPLPASLTPLVAMLRVPSASFPFATKDGHIMNAYVWITRSPGAQLLLTMIPKNCGESVQVPSMSQSTRYQLDDTELCSDRLSTWLFQIPSALLQALHVRLSLQKAMLMELPVSSHSFIKMSCTTSALAMTTKADFGVPPPTTMMLTKNGATVQVCYASMHTQVYKYIV